MIGKLTVIGCTLLVAGAGVSRAVPGGTAGSGRAPARASAPIGSGYAAYAAPVPKPLHVRRAFAPPATPYGPGHLGVDLRATAGQVVRAAGGGVVQFAGSVAGRGVVVVLHADGVRTEYEPVRPVVRAGTRVRRGAPIGILRGRHAGCAASCLHWGARLGERYIDPLALLRPLGPVVLLPWSGAG
jgi:murein DD-endopeptidase MepM/ murein hydrolase activator NlpD